jgi:uncharacterized protein (TIGR00730 family)
VSPVPSLLRICVFCGSSAGSRPEYKAAAAGLGRLLAARGIGLVYGGAALGLMGAVADGALAAGGEVIGVIPKSLERLEIAHSGLSRLHVTGSMHERKALMASLAAGFIALPGGLGTLEELFEVLTWSQLGLHAKPCGLLDVGGYFASLVAFLDHAVAERFVKPQHRAMLYREADPGRLVDLLERHQPTDVSKWILPEEI